MPRAKSQDLRDRVIALRDTRISLGRVKGATDGLDPEGRASGLDRGGAEAIGIVAVDALRGLVTLYDVYLRQTEQTCCDELTFNSCKSRKIGCDHNDTVKV